MATCESSESKKVVAPLIALLRLVNSEPDSREASSGWRTLAEAVERALAECCLLYTSDAADDM
eukprot:1730042-Prymnesium_polylepis.1